MKTIDEKVGAVFDVLSVIYGKSPWSLEQIKDDLSLDTVDYFFVEVDQKIVGFLSVQYLIGEVEITNLAVHPSYQGQGLGHQLMEFLDDVAFPIFLEVRQSNHVAKSLYEKFGFDVVGCRKNYYHEPIEDAVIMKRGGSEEYGR